MSRTFNLSLIHAVALLAGMAQQLVIAYFFGAGDEAGLFFLSLSIPAFATLLFGESLSFSLLPRLIIASDQEKAELIRRSLFVAALLALGALATTLVIGSNWMAAQANGGGFALLSIASSSSALIGMSAAVALAWYQHQDNLVWSALIHLVPSPVMCISAAISDTAMGLAFGANVAGCIQLGLLLYFSPNFRKVLRTILEGTQRCVFTPTRRGGLAQEIGAVAVAASLPMLQMVDRVALGLRDVSHTAAATYAWALTLGLVNLISRAPNLLYTLRLASLRAHTSPSASLLRMPLVLLAAGSTLGLSIALGINYVEWQGGRLEKAIAVIWQFWIPQLLVLGVLSSLGSFFRALSHIRGWRLPALIVLSQPLAHLPLSLAVAPLGSGGGYYWPSSVVGAYLLLAVIVSIHYRPTNSENVT